MFCATLCTTYHTRYSLFVCFAIRQNQRTTHEAKKKQEVDTEQVRTLQVEEKTIILIHYSKFDNTFFFFVYNETANV